MVRNRLGLIWSCITEWKYIYRVLYASLWLHTQDMDLYFGTVMKLHRRPAFKTEEKLVFDPGFSGSNSMTYIMQ